MTKDAVRIIVRTGTPKKTLILRRAKHKHHPGDWTLPGGKVEPGERLAEAVCRELYEETRIATIPSSLKCIHWYQVKDYRPGVDLELWTFLLNSPKEWPVVINDENDEYAWSDLSGLPNNLWDRDIIVEHLA